MESSNDYEVLSCVMWKMAQSFFLLIILSPLQMCCRKKKATTNVSGKVAQKTDASTDTTGAAAQTAVEVNARKADKKKDEPRKDDQTQMEGSEESNLEKADIIPMNKVKVMGNIDEFRKAKKMDMEKAAEEIKSVHEMDNQKALNAVMHSNLHVTIKENKCKLYETNDEPTLDDEAEEPLI
ncbi:Uncharacterized protein BM_BM9401 [Brugia malayi]|uniref:Bm9401 n=1 Tax=Brugia malayi TaxID=6279 RepID=A0A0J9XS30_BRUMA|nr:Uncharacterized protein BM_BM9401 [Brugia malayi]CDP93809.1 Bm9401 [Brugia malayi]VIO97482.1 Uncharacterized protein BM_BM9401 [Brugia malayi]